VLAAVQVQLPVLPLVPMAAVPYLLVRQFVLVPVQAHPLALLLVLMVAAHLSALLFVLTAALSLLPMVRPLYPGLTAILFQPTLPLSYQPAHSTNPRQARRFAYSPRRNTSTYIRRWPSTIQKTDACLIS